MGPVHAAAHVHLAFVEFQQAGTAVLDLGEGEMAVILGVVHDFVRGVGEFERTLRGGHGRAGAVKVHVQPLAAILAVLDLSVHRVLLRVDAQRPGQGDEGDAPGTRSGQPALRNADRRHRDVPGLGIVDDGQVLADDLHQFLGIGHILPLFRGEIPLEKRLVRAQKLVFHTRADDGVPLVVTVHEILQGNVMEVFPAQGLEKRLHALVVLGLGHEGLDRAPVAPGPLDGRCHVMAIAMLLHECEGLVVRRERCLVGVPQGILIGEPPVVFRPLLLRHGRHLHVLRRRNNIQ